MAIGRWRSVGTVGRGQARYLAWASEIASSTRSTTALPAAASGSSIHLPSSSCPLEEKTTLAWSPPSMARNVAS